MFFPATFCESNSFDTQSAPHVPKASSPNITTPVNSDHQVKESTDELSLIWKGVSSSFALPLQELVAEDRSLWNGSSGNLGLNIPVSQSMEANIPAGSAQSPANYNSTATLSLKYTIAGSWFISTSFYYYLDQKQKQDWNPDFTYVFGYSDWRPYTFSLIYSNYGGNRFNPETDQKRTEFSQGTWSLGWKFPITAPLKNWLTFTDKESIGCQIDYNHTAEYFNLNSISYLKNHQTTSLGCKYAIYGNWYINGTVFYYFDNKQKQPWNPDFTYGFGYFDWRPGTITLQYNNYSGNRWSSDNRGKDTGQFKNGSITLAYSFSF
ncbi:MAG: hypothetical protein GY787_03235 [Alteromonadales bacterium]|nr:hypothetical protein [Alteromonadales bacterium]